MEQGGCKEPGCKSQPHALITCSSSSQFPQVHLSEFMVFCSPLLQHCKHLGTMLVMGPIGRMAGNPRSCHEPANPEFNYFRSVDAKQIWLCLHSARISALCQIISGKGIESVSQNLGYIKFLSTISKDTQKHFVPLWCLHWSTFEAAVLPQVPAMCIVLLLGIFSFKPGSLEQNIKCSGWRKTHLKIVKRKPVQLTC